MIKEKQNIHGNIPTVVTPFLEDKSIDYDSWAKQIDMGACSGVLGFLCPCNAMESAFMTEEEKLSLVREAVKAADGRADIVSGVMAYDTHDRMEQCEKYMTAGADALCLNLPYKEDFSVEDYLNAVSDLESFKPKYIILQDASMKDNGLPVEYYVRSFYEHELVTGAKIEVKCRTVR